MKIDLLSIYDKNKKLEQKEKETNKELEKQKALRKILCAVIKGDDYVEITNTDLAKEIGVKTTIVKFKNPYPYFLSTLIIENKRGIKLTKENIKKIQTYLEKEI